ncbi:MAG: tetratricopeptide repeat protein, partial [Planctomycetota bacterium]
MVDEKEHLAYSATVSKNLLFSPDSQHFAYASHQAGPVWRVLFDGEPIAVHACSGIDRVYFSPDNKLYYVVEKKFKSKPGKSIEFLASPGRNDRIEFNEVREPIFSPDGAQVAYIGVTNDEQGKQSAAVVVHNGKPGKTYRWVRNLKFSSDGETLCYFARNEKESVLVVNGEERERFDTVETLVLSPEGGRLAARGLRKEDDRLLDVVVIDGEVVSDHPADLFFYASHEAAPVFSPDGQHCAYFTKQQDWHFLVIDGQTTRPYDRFMFSGPEFVSPTRVRFYAVRDNALLRVHADVRQGSFDSEPVVTEQQVAEWVQQGKEHKEKAPVVAAGYFRKAAERGDLEAQCDLGVLYSHKKLPGANHHETALDWFSKCASRGFPRAQFNMGAVHEDGLGVQKNDGEALRWYRLSAENGYPTAQAELGLRYRDGIGVRKDLVESLRWYRLAAEQGHRVGLFGVAFAYDVGLGVTQDHQRAMRGYRQAAAKGHVSSMDNIGNLYQNGRGAPRNLTAAKEWYRRAARLGSEFSRKRLQNLLPNAKSRRGMYPWFAQTRRASLAVTTGQDREPLWTRE